MVFAIFFTRNRCCCVAVAGIAQIIAVALTVAGLLAKSVNGALSSRFHEADTKQGLMGPAVD